MVPIKALLRMVANHSSVLCVAWSSNARATGRDTWSSTQAWKAISVRCVPSAVLAKTISSPTWRLDFIFLLSDLIPLHVVFDHYLNVSISLLHDLILLRLTKKCRNKAKDVLKLSSWHHAVLEIRRGLTLKPVPIFFPRYISTRTGVRRFSVNSVPLPPPVTSAWSFTCAATSTSHAQTSRWKRRSPPTRRARAPWWVTAVPQTWEQRRCPRCTRTLSSRRPLQSRRPPITSTSRRSHKSETCPCSPPSASAGTVPAAAPTPWTYPE